MKCTLLFSFFLLAHLSIQAQSFNQEEQVVNAVVDQFLLAAGSYDLEAMGDLFAEHANIGGVSNRNGEWVTYTMPFKDFKELLQSDENPAKYTEPVSEYKIHVSENRLAFVKADAQVLREGQPPRTNFDYFTLIKIDGIWKILNGSYVSMPSD